MLGMFAPRGRFVATYFVHRLDNPVNSSIATNSFMLRIDQNDFEVFVGGVLIDPVRVEHAKIGTAAADALFGSRLQGALILELIDTLVGGFA